MDVDTMVPLVRSALAVSASYDDEKIPDLIRRKINRLLRDYHFPKAVQRFDFTLLAQDTYQFDLPAGFKKALEFRLYDPVTNSWTDPLVRRDSFQLPYPSGAPYYYWTQGTQLIIDTPLDASRIGFSGVLWYESMDVPSNEDWIVDDFPDAVMYLSIVSGAAEFRKPEVAQIYGPLWLDEQASLAIYLNELEWNNVVIQQRETRSVPMSRYPA